MIPAEFQYAAPKTVPEAITLLQSNPDAKILSGGQSLIPLMRFRLANPAFLVDNAPLIRARYPLLRDTARVIADPLVRNRATLCGNLAHIDIPITPPKVWAILNERGVAL